MNEPQDETSDTRYDAGNDAGRWGVEPRAMAKYGRHSRFVSFMKFVLPLGAMALLGTVLFYSGIFDKHDKLDITFREIASLNNDLRMVSPRVNGLDNAGKPYLLTADTATQSKANPSQVTLDNVQADLKLTDGDEWVSLSSTSGLLDTETKLITFGTKIDVYASTGYEFHGETGSVNFSKGTFSTDDPVTGHGPSGTLRADRMTADSEKREMIFVGHVKMRLYGGP